ASASGALRIETVAGQRGAHGRGNADRDFRSRGGRAAHGALPDYPWRSLVVPAGAGSIQRAVEGLLLRRQGRARLRVDGVGPGSFARGRRTDMNAFAHRMASGCSRLAVVRIVVCAALVVTLCGLLAPTAHAQESAAEPAPLELAA